jgi:NADPH:quinone reductase-like Zn-dependent oxidoreductase
MVPKDQLAALPAGVDPVDAATAAITGLTALQTIGSSLKEGDKMFINGGSGGTGVFSIQIAEQLCPDLLSINQSVVISTNSQSVSLRVVNQSD